VESFAKGYGLQVDSVPSNHACVYVIGSVLQMEHAFDTTILRYWLHGTTVEAPSREASVPGAGGNRVEGLNTTDVARPLISAATPPTPAYVNASPFSSYWAQSLATQAPGAYGTKVLPNVPQGYTPQQLQGGYGISSPIKQGLDGSGQTLAVIDAYSSPTLTSDADTWS
jgi:subtilase family serine protease